MLFQRIVGAANAPAAAQRCSSCKAETYKSTRTWSNYSGWLCCRSFHWRRQLPPQRFPPASSRCSIDLWWGGWVEKACARPQGGWQRTRRACARARWRQPKARKSAQRTSIPLSQLTQTLGEKIHIPPANSWANQRLAPPYLCSPCNSCKLLSQLATGAAA